jgi:hypothetical protein
LKRQEASKFRQSITSGIRFVQPVTPAGVILPPDLSIRVDPPRVVEVLIRIVKGLYLRETGHRLPSTRYVLPYVTSSPGEMGRRQISGWYSGTARESQDTLEFSALSDVHPMIEKFPLSRVAEAYERMHSGKVRFRVVLTIGS